ncbi:MAG: SRPBCC domain-containing protein [Alphaproteobacteria bacterium]|nr:SRPBCC domain-containing protein [Alphaproteobacteria bacterium]MCB9793603.1 SRPBCC domain-containing protein [Alphaproteobacteria bacterium]
MSQDSVIEGREVRIVRELRWTPEQVWAAWTRPEALSQWYGPEGFRTETERFELRPGGEWVFRMIHPEHGTYPNHVRFLEVAPPERVVYEHVEGGEHRFLTQFTLTRVAGGTRVELLNRFPTAEALRKVIEEVDAVEGGRQTLARLDAFVAAEEAARAS